MKTCKFSEFEAEVLKHILCKEMDNLNEEERKAGDTPVASAIYWYKQTIRDIINELEDKYIEEEELPFT